VSIKNVWAGDLALVELLAGGTEAPAEVLQKLVSLGHVKLVAGKPSLTAAGRSRAKRLKPAANDLRRMSNASPGAPVKTVGQSSLHVGGGGPPQIRL
jgi:hypothetical protein